MKLKRARVLAIFVTAGVFLLSAWPMRNLRTPRPYTIPLRPDLLPSEKMTVRLEGLTLNQAGRMYADLTGRILLPRTNDLLARLDELTGERLSHWHVLRRLPALPSGIEYHRDGMFNAIEVKEQLESFFRAKGVAPLAEGRKYLRLEENPASPYSRRD